MTAINLNFPDLLKALRSVSEPCSSVSVVSGYGLDDRANDVQSPTEAKGFFLLPLCPDRPWGPPCLLNGGYRGSFPGGKARLGRDADHSPHLVPRWRMSRSYTSSPPSASMACSGTALSLTSVKTS
jgi:hypothetical protein